ncbi:hypothetical protein HRbin02_00352 [Candidatus Calditenuaceae archaeon HR02]|nr:hypothetical protein HRbin02_00352 [Candidatus Calditenuaceae archaeon HR02]
MVRKRKGNKKSNILLYSIVASVITILLALVVVLNQGSTNSEKPTFTSIAYPVVKLYRTSLCDCCGKYEGYLKSRGVQVQTVMMDPQGLLDMRKKLGIPSQLFSCHTSVLDGYFVEGHVPLEAISNLLVERPDVDGIALPGMPQGSPGMDGSKTGPLKIYSKTGDSITIFMEL